MAKDRHPLSSEGISILFGLFGVPYAIGITLMLLDRPPLFWFGILLVLFALAGALWAFRDEWGRVISKPIAFWSEQREFHVAVVTNALFSLLFLIVMVNYWPTSAPISVATSVGLGNYPTNEPIAGIKWMPAEFAELRIAFTNPTERDYRAFYARIDSELPIFDMGQTTNLLGCSIQPAVDFSKMGHVGNMLAPKMSIWLRGDDGKSYEINPTSMLPWPEQHLIGLVPSYEVRCGMLPRAETLELIAAVISMSRYATNSGKRPPDWVIVSTNYESDGRTHEANYQFACRNFRCITTVRTPRFLLITAFTSFVLIVGGRFAANYGTRS